MMKVGKKEAFQMTAKTHGYITKEIELEQIYQFILKFFDFFGFCHVPVRLVWYNKIKANERSESK